MADGVDVRGYFHSLIRSEGDVFAPLRGMRVVIVGGVQTSVHLAQLAVSKSRFWSHDREHRGRIRRDVKGGPCNAGSRGASVDGECVDRLRSSGVHVREQCEVLSAPWLSNPTSFSNAE